jgi:hypothetical protein
MLYVHGTTLENAQKMLRGEEKSSYTWTCSDDNYVYLWDVDSIGKEYDHDPEQAKNEAIQRAYEAAKITACISKNYVHKLIVFIFDLDSALVEDDTSCPNMTEARRIEFTPELMKHVVEVYEIEHNPRLDILTIAGLKGMKLFPSYLIDDDLLDIAGKIDLSSLYLEDYASEKMKETYVDRLIDA